MMLGTRTARQSESTSNPSHVAFDRLLQRLRLRAADAVDLLLVFPKVEGRERADALAAHELVGRWAAVTHHLEKVHILVLLTELVEFGRDYFARAAPRSRVVDNHQRFARRLESCIKLLSG